MMRDFGKKTHRRSVPAIPGSHEDQTDRAFDYGTLNVEVFHSVSRNQAIVTKFRRPYAPSRTCLTHQGPGQTCTLPDSSTRTTPERSL